MKFQSKIIDRRSSQDITSSPDIALLSQQETTCTLPFTIPLRRLVRPGTYKAHLPPPTSSFLMSLRALGYLFRPTSHGLYTNLRSPLIVSLRTFTTTTTFNMRVPYAPSEPPNEEARPIYERIAERRKPRPLIPLDLALLHNPSVADGWNSFIGAIRTKTSLSESVKELAIARVAVLNHAVHEWDIHAALAVKAGVSRDVMQVVFELPVTSQGTMDKEALGKLSEEEQAVLLYTDQMTVGVKVDEQLTERLKKVLGNTKVVELTATVAAYNAVSRFLVALDVGECNGRAMKEVANL